MPKIWSLLNYFGSDYLKQKGPLTWIPCCVCSSLATLDYSDLIFQGIKLLRALIPSHASCCLVLPPKTSVRGVPVLVEDKLVDFKHVTHTEWGVVCAWRCEWDSTFGLFTRKLGGSRHTYSHLWFSSGKIKLPCPDKKLLTCLVLFCLVSIVLGLM